MSELEQAIAIANRFLDDAEPRGERDPDGDECVLARQFNRFRERTTDEVAWLVERHDSIRYWGRDTTGFGGEPCFWTPDHAAAMRFARQEDAQMFIDWKGWQTVARPVEHMWTPGR